MSATKSIRDFIYVDGDRLHSLYSQVFEGKPEQIVKSELQEERQADSQKGRILSGGGAESQFAESKQLTESRVLHDHMYEQLVTKISSAIKVPSDVTAENYRDELDNTFMIKVSGIAEIEDYDRVKLFAERYNELAGSLAFVDVINKVGVSLHQAEALLKSSHARDKTGVKNYVQRLKDPKRLAIDAGWYQDEEALSVVQLFTELFYPEGFEVTVTPRDGAGKVAYRGVLNKRWLRIQPDYLKALYGALTNSSWTMVGQVTYMPGGTTPSFIKQVVSISPESVENAVEDEGEQPGLDKKPQEEPSMRDPFRTVFAGLRGFEHMFLESKERVEIIVFPLAIYREVEIPISS